MSIGERIMQLRTEQNISQAQLASALDVSRQAVSKWENDQTAPDTIKLIHLAEYLDTDVEYLATGRRSYGRRPPVVLKTVETVEKVVEKPVVKVVEKVVEKPIVQYQYQYIEKPVVQYVEKPVIKRVERKKYVRNPLEFLIAGVVCFVFGLVIGLIL